MNSKLFVVVILSLFAAITALPSRTSTLIVVKEDEGGDENIIDSVPGSSIRGFKVGRLPWPKGIVYYRFTEDVGIVVENAMLFGMSALSAATDNFVTFVQNDLLQTGVLVISETGAYVEETKHFEIFCIAEVGYFPDRKQVLNLNPDKCGTTWAALLGSAVHELIHALGFVHEFQRHDRDQYITLDEPKLKEFLRTQVPDRTPEELDELNILNFGAANDVTLETGYDFNSIMNYDFGDLVTAVMNPPKKTHGLIKNMGNQCAISDLDRTMISKAYRKTFKRGNAQYWYYRRYFNHYPLVSDKSCKEKLGVMADEIM